MSNEDKNTSGKKRPRSSGNQNVIETCSNKELFERALIDLDSEDSEKAVLELHRRATRDIFDEASKLCQSGLPTERRCGAEILSLLGFPDLDYSEESFEVLMEMLSVEDDPDVIWAIGYAFFWIGEKDDKIPGLLEPFKENSDPGVRESVAYGLRGQDSQLAIEILIELSRDGDRDVRDQATFELGVSLDEDTPEIRSALVERLEDSDPEVRESAIEGLGRRNDERSIDGMIALLSDHESIPDTTLLWSVPKCEDAALYAALLSWREEASEGGEGWSELTRKALVEALEKCMPSEK